MRYSSFPGRINMEKTFEQCFRPPLLPENKKAVRLRLNIKERLYNEVRSPEEEDHERKRKNIKEELL